MQRVNENMRKRRNQLYELSFDENNLQDGGGL